MTNIKIFTYKEQEIEFDLTPKSVMVNATEMAKPFGKKVVEFMSNDATKRFIQACLKNANSRFLEDGKSGNSHFLEIEKEDDLITSKQRSGTWMHRILALKFAAWLDPDFEVWVYQTIDDLLFGRISQRSQLLKQKTMLELEIETLEREWRQSDPYKKILGLQNKVNQLNRQARQQDRLYVAEQMPLWSEEK